MLMGNIASPLLKLAGPPASPEGGPGGFTRASDRACSTCGGPLSSTPEFGITICRACGFTPDHCQCQARIYGPRTVLEVHSGGSA